MQRRAFLASVGAAASLAGCVDAGRRRPGVLRRRVTVRSVDDPPPGADLSLGVTVVDPAITPADTARLRVSLTNRAEEPRWTRARRRIFDPLSSAGSPELLALPPDLGLDRTDPDCWRPAVENRAALRPNAGTRWFEHAPGRLTTTTRALWGTARNGGGCLPTGAYRFETAYRVADERGGEVRTLPWGFVLALTEA